MFVQAAGAWAGDKQWAVFLMLQRGPGEDMITPERASLSDSGAEYQSDEPTEKQDFCVLKP